MSNALAIAHVTQALALLIENNVGPEFGEAVKVEPRKPPADPQLEQPTISVFLYQVTPNTSRRNDDLPTRASDGTLVRRPAAALDLHYLISAYGDEKELVGQRLIGSVVRTLHEIPVLPKDVVEQAGERPYLAGSDLAEAAQRIRFAPSVMDVDETSKLWGMLYQTPYTLSVVYQAALVLIDGRETPAPRKPVERPEVRVLPFGAPGAPVPPGAEPEDAPPAEAEAEAEPADAAAGAAAGAGAGARAEKAARTPAKTPAKAVAKTAAGTTAKTVAKTAAKTVGKAPSRTRKPTTGTGTRGGSAQPETGKSAPRKPVDDGTER
ncbi:DUF4255 domain-containing protein [Streptomyces sp. NPDC007901]|uniref:DUF4255 domain-containing protein n=1 Tax=Streptomyces sp. NPDC007901 TaxID=3364785 RepID=UPI0036F16DFE